MRKRRRAALIKEFTRVYGFRPSPGELRQFKKSVVRKDTRVIRLDHAGPGFYSERST